MEVEGRLQGWSDSPLTERGLRQVGLLRDALRLVPLDAIYSGTSGRALARL